MDLFSKKPDELTVGETVTANIIIAAAVSAASIGGIALVGLAFAGYDKLREKMNKKTESE